MGRLQLDELRDAVHRHPNRCTTEDLLGDFIGVVLHLAPDQERPPSWRISAFSRANTTLSFARRRSGFPERPGAAGASAPAWAGVESKCRPARKSNPINPTATCIAPVSGRPFRNSLYA